MKNKRLFSRILLLIVFLICFILLIRVYTGEGKSLEYYGNPLFEGWYADPEVAIFNDTCWIYPTYSAAFAEQVFMDAFSSPDLIHWTRHERIIDTSLVSWADSAMWAPCVIEKENKYYLFFAANDIQTKESSWYKPDKHAGMTGGIGVAVADQPAGPYKDLLGKPLIGEVYNSAQPIDQFVYEEDGKYYILYGGWGRCNIGILNEDFSGLQTFKDGKPVKEITPEGYVEGPFLFKRNDLYYLMWSEGGWTNASYAVAYGVSKDIFGPYERKGVILKQDPDIATGAGHHSLFHIPGKDEWYIVYHRRPIPNEGRDHRVTCMDRLYFDDKGEILPVIMTFKGVEERDLQNTSD